MTYSGLNGLLSSFTFKPHVSEGMILSAENNDGSLAVIMPQKEVKPGSEVK